MVLPKTVMIQITVTYLRHKPRKGVNFEADAFHLK